ncbi:MAG TPA: sulfate/molybdate ABC transporter ATP-binding protein [Negativicutes bacterium]|nr:sulfate/molybdate ABC transporter ATP-binding protein [Negativicutes bacterium]
MSLYVDIKKKFSDFNLEVSFEAGTDAVGLLGPSGSGKSMTLRCIAGIETPDSGRIVLNGNTLYDSEKGINLPSRKRRLGFLFQNYALFPNMTVESNISFGLSGFSTAKQAEKVGEMISLLHLQGLEKRYPSQLSGGQQQRVALARALVIEPEALLLDEPFSALDEHLRDSMLVQMVETLADYGGVTLYVTHNMEEAYRVCKDLVVLSSGRLEASGDKEYVFMRPPTVGTARITGCKNLSPARLLSPCEIEAEDWGVRLRVNEDSISSIGHVGIHAHYIDLAEAEDNENTVSCRASFTSETPFGVTVYLSVENKASGDGDYRLQWELPREKWERIRDVPQPWKLKLKRERLMLF